MLFSTGGCFLAKILVYYFVLSYLTRIFGRGTAVCGKVVPARLSLWFVILLFFFCFFGLSLSALFLTLRPPSSLKWGIIGWPPSARAALMCRPRPTPHINRDAGPELPRGILRRLCILRPSHCRLARVSYSGVIAPVASWSSGRRNGYRSPTQCGCNCPLLLSALAILWLYAYGA